MLQLMIEGTRGRGRASNAQEEGARSIKERLQTIRKDMLKVRQGRSVEAPAGVADGRTRERIVVSADDRSWLAAMIMAGAEMHVKANRTKYGPPHDMLRIYQDVTDVQALTALLQQRPETLLHVLTVLLHLAGR